MKLAPFLKVTACSLIIDHLLNFVFLTFEKQQTRMGGGSAAEFGEKRPVRLDCKRR